jgi:hypothetical protein
MGEHYFLDTKNGSGWDRKNRGKGAAHWHLQGKGPLLLRAMLIPNIFRPESFLFHRIQIRQTCLRSSVSTPITLPLHRLQMTRALPIAPIRTA